MQKTLGSINVKEILWVKYNDLSFQYNEGNYGVDQREEIFLR